MTCTLEFESNGQPNIVRSAIPRSITNINL